LKINANTITDKIQAKTRTTRDSYLFNPRRSSKRHRGYGTSYSVLVFRRLMYLCTIVHRNMRKKYDFSQGKRGAVVPVPAGKTRVTIRLDTDVLDWFRDEVDKAGGGNYQSLINLALRDFVSRSKEPLEKTLRRVIREELRRAG
jgi:uncharacterized protein (DUF4415 family)